MAEPQSPFELCPPPVIECTNGAVIEADGTIHQPAARAHIDSYGQIMASNSDTLIAARMLVASHFLFRLNNELTRAGLVRYPRQFREMITVYSSTGWRHGADVLPDKDLYLQFVRMTHEVCGAPAALGDIADMFATPVVRVNMDERHLYCKLYVSPFALPGQMLHQESIPTTSPSIDEQIAAIVAHIHADTDAIVSMTALGKPDEMKEAAGKFRRLVLKNTLKSAFKRYRVNHTNRQIVQQTAQAISPESSAIAPVNVSGYRQQPKGLTPHFAVAVGIPCANEDAADSAARTLLDRMPDIGKPWTVLYWPSGYMRGSHNQDRWWTFWVGYRDAPWDTYWSVLAIHTQHAQPTCYGQMETLKEFARARTVSQTR